MGRGPMMFDPFVIAITLLVVVLLGVVVGYFFRKISYEKTLAATRENAEAILEEANREAALIKKNAENVKKRSAFRSERRNTKVPNGN